jgi:NAD(P)-dependent dehydrogenase (short-subunit alcohol dehydrogenase family)
MAKKKAVAVVCDVSRREELERLADEAIRNVGRIDTWVSKAGVVFGGRIEEVSETDMRQLFETDFWGEVGGLLVALPHLKEQGGALINMGVGEPKFPPPVCAPEDDARLVCSQQADRSARHS